MGKQLAFRGAGAPKRVGISLKTKPPHPFEQLLALVSR